MKALINSFLYCLSLHIMPLIVFWLICSSIVVIMIIILRSLSIDASIHRFTKIIKKIINATQGERNKKKNCCYSLISELVWTTCWNKHWLKASLLNYLKRWCVCLLNICLRIRRIILGIISIERIRCLL